MAHSRRPIACTICAKAKTKCDKLTPSCSRCTQKGLQCQPRSTRRTSDSYRQTKNKTVSPKRFPSTSSNPTCSPRSVPSSTGHHLVRATSQIDMNTAIKMGRQTDLNGIQLLSPLPLYSPQNFEGCYSDFGSPDQGLAGLPPHFDKAGIMGPGIWTPQTPDSFSYGEPLPMGDPFDQYITPQTWPDGGSAPIGLGLQHDFTGMMTGEPMMQMWPQDVDENATPVGRMCAFESPLCESPTSTNAWPNHSVSASPQPLEHTRAVPSLSISECSILDSDSPTGKHEDWTNFHCDSNGMEVEKSATTTYFNGVQPMTNIIHGWEASMLPRSPTY